MTQMGEKNDKSTEVYELVKISKEEKTLVNMCATIGIFNKKIIDRFLEKFDYTEIIVGRGMNDEPYVPLSEIIIDAMRDGLKGMTFQKEYLVFVDIFDKTYFDHISKIYYPKGVYPMLVKGSKYVLLIAPRYEEVKHGVE